MENISREFDEARETSLHAGLAHQQGKCCEERFSTGKHDRLLRGYAYELVSTIETKLKEPPCLWERFHLWLHESPARAEACKMVASAILLKLMDNCTIANVEQYIRYRVHAYRLIGVQVDESIYKAMDARAVVWSESVRKQRAKFRHGKEEQYTTLVQCPDRFVNGFSAVDPVVFREHLKKHTLPAICAHETGISTCSTEVLQGLVGKSDDEVLIDMLRLHTYIAWGAQTGLRSGHLGLLTFRKLNMVHEGNPQEGVFMVYENGKDGRKKNSYRTCWSRVVPHVDPQRCALARLGVYLVFLHARMRVRTMIPYPFMYGMRQMKTIAYNSLSREYQLADVRVKKKLTGLLEGYAHFLGMARGIGVKKLHVFRSLCVTALARAKVSAPERYMHLGWRVGIETQHYHEAQSVALTINAPFVLAGRADASVRGHALWDSLSRVPDEYCVQLCPESAEHPVYLLLLKAGILSIAWGYAPLAVESRVSSLQWARALRPSHGPTSHAPRHILEEAIREFKQQGRAPDFPARAFVWLRDVACAHIDACTQGGSFGLNRSKGIGVTFTCILKLAALHKLDPLRLNIDIGGKSWINWALKEGKDTLSSVEVHTWDVYKKRYLE